MLGLKNSFVRDSMGINMAGKLEAQDKYLHGIKRRHQALSIFKFCVIALLLLVVVVLAYVTYNQFIQ